eukprot:c22055_g1_i1 orf=391-630(-)
MMTGSFHPSLSLSEVNIEQILSLKTFVQTRRFGVLVKFRPNKQKLQHLQYNNSHAEPSCDTNPRLSPHICVPDNTNQCM